MPRLSFALAVALAAAVGFAYYSTAVFWASWLFLAAVAVLIVLLDDQSRARWYAATISLPLPQELILARPSMADLFLLPTIAVKLRHPVRSWRELPHTTLLFPAMGLVAAFAIATGVAYARDGRVSMWALVNKDAGLLLQVAALAVLTTTLRTRAQVLTATRWFAVGVGVINFTALIGVLLALAGFENRLYFPGNARFYGWMANPSVNGGLLLSAALVELGVLSNRNVEAPWRRWRWASVWLLGVGIALTLSRSTWLSVATGAGVLCLLLILELMRGCRPRPLASLAVVVWFMAPTAMIGYIAQQNRAAGVAIAPEQRASELKAVLVDQCTQNATLDICKDVQMPVASSVLTSAAPPVAARVPPASAAPAAPVTAAPVTAAPVTAAPVTAPPVTAAPVRAAPVTAAPVTAAPVPAAPVTAPVAADTSGALMNARGLNDRVAIARSALTKYAATPGTMAGGIGLGSYYATSAGEFGVPLIIHNTFVWFLVELGPLGFAMLLWVIGQTVWNLVVVTLQGEDRGLATGLLASLAALLMFFIFNEGFYQRSVWLIIAFADRLRCLTPVASEPARQATA